MAVNTMLKEFGSTAGGKDLIEIFDLSVHFKPGSLLEHLDY